MLFQCKLVVVEITMDMLFPHSWKTITKPTQVKPKYVPVYNKHGLSCSKDKQGWCRPQWEHEPIDSMLRGKQFCYFVGTWCPL